MYVTLDCTPKDDIVSTRETRKSPGMFNGKLSVSSLLPPHASKVDTNIEITTVRELLNIGITPEYGI